MSVSSPSASVSTLTAESINPIIESTKAVFDMMLGAEVRRSGLSVKPNKLLAHELSAVIGMTGQVSGTLVISFSREVAFSILDRLLGETTDEINDAVCDAVGELTNMIAGGAKAKMEHLALSLSIPNLVKGAEHEVVFPSEVTPLSIAFESDLGPFCIDIGFSVAGI